MCYFVVIEAAKYFFAYLYICILVFFCLFDGMHLPKIQKQMQTNIKKLAQKEAK